MTAGEKAWKERVGWCESCAQLREEVGRMDRKNCKEVPPGNGICDMCAAGEPELCRYVNTNGAMKEIDRLRADNARLREAVEWALGTLDGNADRRYIQAELRLRTTEGLGG